MTKYLSLIYRKRASLLKLLIPIEKGRFSAPLMVYNAERSRLGEYLACLND